MSSDLRIVTPTRISLKDDPHLNQFWLQDQIARHPSILGLGDLILRERGMHVLRCDCSDQRKLSISSRTTDSI